MQYVLMGEWDIFNGTSIDGTVHKWATSWQDRCNKWNCQRCAAVLSLWLPHLRIQNENQLFYCLLFPCIRNFVFVELKCWDLVHVQRLMAAVKVKAEGNHPPCLSRNIKGPHQKKMRWENESQTEWCQPDLRTKWCVLALLYLHDTKSDELQTWKETRGAGVVFHPAHLLWG